MGYGVGSGEEVGAPGPRAGEVEAGQGKVGGGAGDEAEQDARDPDPEGTGVLHSLLEGTGPGVGDLGTTGIVPRRQTGQDRQVGDHAGQIAFPGGKIDPGDESPVGAALREATEEIGLPPVLVEPIGYLDLYLTFSGFRILPTVARVKPEFKLTLNPREVVEAFEVPLEFLMTPANHQRKTRDWKGIAREYYAMPFEDRYIWGVTAGILRNMYERLYRP